MRIFAPSVFDGYSFATNQILTIEQGVIIAIADGIAEEADTQLSGTVCPGFIDVQVNGGGGHLFNNSPNVQALKAMRTAHARFGTTSMLPTVISDNYDIMLEAAQAVCSAIQAPISGILGIHFEGPHLSVAKRGIHPERNIRQLSDRELDLFTRKDIGTVCVTLAPETVSADVIKVLVEKGVIVCLGHSNADSDVVMAAIEAGASGFTHLYNAMSPLHSRQAGVTGAALLSDCYAGLIVDMHHVCQHSAQLAIKAKGVDKIMLVTDSMSHIGTEHHTLEFAGNQIIKQGDKLTLADGTLAGSALTMSQAVKNTIISLHRSFQDAICMASANPATFLGVFPHKGALIKGSDADFVCMDSDYRVTNTFIGGTEVFKAS